MALPGRDTDGVVTGYQAIYAIEITGSEDSFPANPDTAVAAGWKDVGYTEDGAGWRWIASRTFTDVRVEEEVLPIDTKETEQAATIQAVLAQTSLEHLRLVFGGGTIQTGTPVGYSTWEPPALGTEVFWKLLIRAYASQPSAGALKRDIWIPKVRPTGGIDMGFRRTEKSTLNAEFTVLVPEAGGETSGKPYRVIDDLTA